MKRYIRLMVVFILGATLLGAGSTQSLAAKKNTSNGNQNQTATTNTENSSPDPTTANNKNNKALHRDGSSFVKESRITQADRQAAANRAKAKGMVVPQVGEPAVSGAMNTQTGSEAKQ